MFSKIGEFFSDPRVAIPFFTALGMLTVGGGTWFATRSWLIAIAVALGLALVVLIVILLRTLRSGEREERLAGGLEDRGSAGTGPATIGIRSIFNQAITEIKRSRLGAEGLHELPWWITLGPTSSGKTELVRSSGLDVPAEFAHSLRPGPTAGCNFVLSNHAVILDTAGAFVDAGDEAPEDWSTILRLLKKNRPHGPLEGILIGLSAVSLLTEDRGRLDETARSIRRRLNEITVALGFDIPIYLVITHLDRIQGFAEFITALPAERAREAFGWTNDRRVIPDVAETAQASLSTVIDQLELILPELILRTPDPVSRRNLYLFTQELHALTTRVVDVLGSPFARSVYDGIPFLRGVYFASATRGGPTLSSVATRIGQDWANGSAQPNMAAGGFFTTGLFREIMLGDDELAVETAGVGRRTRHVVVGLAAAVSITCLALAGVSFVENYAAIRDLEARTGRLLDAPSSLDAADALRESILASRSADAALAVPFMATTRNRAADNATATFLWALEREHIRPTKQRIAGILRRADHDAFEALAVLAMDVSWLVSRTESNPDYRPNIVQYTSFTASERDRTAFSESYDAYVRWLPEPRLKTVIKDERNSVLDSATSLLDLRRLEEWSERRADRQPPVQLTDFGLDTSGLSTVPSVSGAYTRQGWEGLVRDLLSAVEESGGAADENIRRFRTGYVDRFDRSWRELLLATPMRIRASTAVFESPHFRLFKRLAYEVAAELPRNGRRPDWMSLAISLRDETEAPRPTGAPEGAPPPPPTWIRYRQALDRVQIEAGDAANKGEDQALEIALRMGGDSPFTGALGLLDDLIPPRSETRESRKIREILSMPILEAGKSVLESALPALDSRWYKSIYRPYTVEGRDPISLYDPDGGALTEFLERDLGPFFDRDEPKKVLGNLELPMSSAFLAWLEGAQKLQGAFFPASGGEVEIPVRLEGIPSRVVGRSDVFVTRRELSLDCAASVQSFEYREGTGSETLVWTPDCQTVTLRIWIKPPGEPTRELMPRREWTGPLALPRFFQEATRASQNRFQWNLKYDDIEVRIEYRMRSGKALLDFVHTPPPSSLKGRADAR